MGSEWGAPDRDARIAAHRMPGKWDAVKFTARMYGALWIYNRRLWGAVTFGLFGAFFILVALVALVLGLLTGCGPSKSSSPGQRTAYAGDGVTQFGDASDGATGKLKWATTYYAVAVDTTDRQNCKWSLYTINKQGDHEVQILKRGNYFNAKINMGQQFTKRVYLKSLECGLWKP